MIVLEAGNVFAGRYRLEACLGAGAMGAVWRATQLSLFGRQVALKFILPAAGQDARHRELFEVEASVLARVDHPNICPVLDFGEDGGVLWLAMGYVDGWDLGRVLRASGSGVPVPLAVHVTGQIVLALQHAHERGVIHRDLKPSNVLVSRGGDVRLTDFGIAKLLEPGQSGSTSTMMKGSPGYVAPEILRSGPTTPRADLFGVGVILFELLTGRNPFVEGPLADREQILLATLNLDPPSLASLGIAAPPALERILGSALAKDPARRCASAEKLYEELHAVAVGLGGQASVPGWRRFLARLSDLELAPGPAALAATVAASSVHVSAMAGQVAAGRPAAKKKRRRSRTVVIAAAGGTVTLIALALLLLSRGGPPAVPASAPAVAAPPAQVATPDASARDAAARAAPDGG